ncbi:MAG TPA: hypothetical protein VHM91_24110 [Verrucomicrobiales bacterium]|jgi:pimeloyl-ACP methyl ester carboxylesterase|nr:hypothetical protein [Verrucomicrobiales bacterium]
MDYQTARKLEIHDAHQRLIEPFANTYRCGLPTIVLLPGGMGSHLDRSTRPFKNAASIPFEAYDPVWMDLEIIFGRDADLIRIQENGHDAGEHIIVPNGPLRFLVNGYDGTEKFFRALGWNYIVFGYDWRQPVSEGAAQLEDFLVRLRDRVKDLRDCDPLPTTTLIAHSQGGLVAKVFLERVVGDDGKNLGLWCERLVTVGTPFYGTATHQDRYYQGQSPLNTFYGKKSVAQLAGSLPGPYILMHADFDTIERDRAALGLDAYPVTDTKTSEPVDPYDPANAGRFPSWVPPQFLSAARDLRETITFELPDAAAERVFHIRTGLTATKGERLVWSDVNGVSYDPSAGSPLKALPGPGDGTVPFWSARLAQTPDSRIFNLKIAKDHGSLIEHEETLTVIQSLVEKGKLPATVQAEDRSLGVAKASTAKTRTFINKVLAGELKKSDPEANVPAVWRRILEETLLS